MNVDPLITALTRRRKDRRLTQVVVADLAGLSRPYLRRVEAGDSSPSLQVLRRLADALGLELTITPKAGA